MGKVWRFAKSKTRSRTGLYHRTRAGCSQLRLSGFGGRCGHDRNRCEIFHGAAERDCIVKRMNDELRRMKKGTTSLYLFIIAPIIYFLINLNPEGMIRY